MVCSPSRWRSGQEEHTGQPGLQVTFTSRKPLICSSGPKSPLQADGCYGYESQHVLPCAATLGSNLGFPPPPPPLLKGRFACQNYRKPTAPGTQAKDAKIKSFGLHLMSPRGRQRSLSGTVLRRALGLVRGHEVEGLCSLPAESQGRPLLLRKRRLRKRAWPWLCHTQG